MERRRVLELDEGVIMRFPVKQVEVMLTETKSFKVTVSVQKKMLLTLEENGKTKWWEHFLPNLKGVKQITLSVLFEIGSKEGSEDEEYLNRRIGGIVMGFGFGL